MLGEQVRHWEYTLLLSFLHIPNCLGTTSTPQLPLHSSIVICAHTWWYHCTLGYCTSRTSKLVELSEAPQTGSASAAFTLLTSGFPPISTQLISAIKDSKYIGLRNMLPEGLAKAFKCAKAGKDSRRKKKNVLNQCPPWNGGWPLLSLLLW